MLVRSPALAADDPGRDLLRVRANRRAVVADLVGHRLCRPRLNTGDVAAFCAHRSQPILGNGTVQGRQAAGFWRQQFDWPRPRLRRAWLSKRLSCGQPVPHRPIWICGEKRLPLFVSPLFRCLRVAASAGPLLLPRVDQVSQAAELRLPLADKATAATDDLGAGRAARARADPAIVRNRRSQFFRPGFSKAGAAPPARGSVSSLAAFPVTGGPAGGGGVLL